MRFSYRILLSVLSGILLALSFPRVNFWFFAWVAMIPVLFAIEGQKKRVSFLLSFIFGLVFWVFNVYWIIHVTLVGLIFLVLYLTLFFALWGVVVSSVNLGKFVVAKVFFISAVWACCEYLRGICLTGFPWSLLGYSQSQNLMVIQIADIFGPWGVSFLIVLVNIFLKEVIGKRIKIYHWIGLIIIFSAVLLYGFYQIRYSEKKEIKKYLDISLIQGNISQEDKWDPAKRKDIINKYVKLTLAALQEDSQLVIWPEASWPVILQVDLNKPEAFGDFLKDSKSNLLIGAVTREEDLYFNSAILLSENKVSKYDKLHLVPFGEYIPLRKIFPFLETIAPIGEIEPGKKYEIFEVDNLKEKVVNKFAVLICIEDCFSNLARKFVKKGAQFLVNITNDGWYLKTSAPYMHLQASIFRAVENKVPLVRAANTGISAFIDANGRVVSVVKDGNKKEIFIEGKLTQKIRIDSTRKTLYTIYGDWFILLCFVFSGFLVGKNFRLRNKC